ncbi:DNA alkylation repair protein [Aliikangiella marina]|uniref:DNA alkylation repair protein n=1 Tax=Aliikangiella marina TaxID=1712262 RepID=A0A545TDU6_9GAMM|nr:DNA alkylation repair protein [Aliikangiella marina]TQV75394.1 DNA alkylation repair protein [Aliikangiella marina]
MAEPLKNLYSKQLVQKIARAINAEYTAFNTQEFERAVLTRSWKNLELKQRMRCISTALGKTLPEDYLKSVAILKVASTDFSGLEHLVFPDFVEQFGLQYPQQSLDALAFFTTNSTAEFAVRPFILAHPEKTMKFMRLCASSDNEHVRRLASEGCRPRLPWAIALPEFKRNPQPVLDIILGLIDDNSLYVRRSVANNLNDISKDNPETVIKVAKQLKGKSSNVDWALKHACRGLLKKGNLNVLELFGFADTKHVEIRGFKMPRKIEFGGELNFQFELRSTKKRLGKLRLEFIIDFVKANGKTSPKIFKISEGDFQERERSVGKRFSFKPVTTRSYYPGTHRLSIVVNGNNLTSREFELIG